MGDGVAVVIVTYRTAALTIDALVSIAAERHADRPSLCVTVVDNASGDAAVLAPEIHRRGWQSWVDLVVAPKNGGFAYGNNLGIMSAFARAIPPYVYLLNPDAQVRPDAIWALYSFLEQHPDVGIAGSSFEEADGTPWPIAFRFPSLVSEVCDGMQIGIVSKIFADRQVAMIMGNDQHPVDWICGASMLIRSSVIRSLGGMDERYFLYFEETDFCLRARNAGVATWYVPQSRVMHIMGQSTKVTEVRSEPRRLPSYWFESRRRYFLIAYGRRKAVAIDICTILARTIGLLKAFALRQRHRLTPYFIRDLLCHSVIKSRNRVLEAPIYPLLDHDFGEP